MQRKETILVEIGFEEALRALGKMAERGRRGEFCQRHIEEMVRIAIIIAAIVEAIGRAILHVDGELRRG